MSSHIQSQILLKQQLQMKKRMVAEAQITGEQIQVEISELNKVKGFGQTTIDKLRSK